MATLTAHCLIKNEENFVWYAIKSVVDFVDLIIIFDTGSTDKTVEIVQGLVKEYPDKIIFEEKGECDKTRHTELRQEMLERTTTDWFMILDGDEVWTRKGIEEALKVIRENNRVECLIVPYYLCVGDIYHHSIRGKYKYLLGENKRELHASPRLFLKKPETRWNLGLYGEGDFIMDNEGNIIREEHSLFLRNKYWHASALIRSSHDNDVFLGRHKQVITYSLKIIGEGLKIKEAEPEVFKFKKSIIVEKLPLYRSWINLFVLILYKIENFKKKVFMNTKEEINILWNKSIYYQEIEKQHTHENLEAQFFIKELLNLLNQGKIFNILDIGSGEGSIINFLSHYCKDKKFYGIDVAEIGIRKSIDKNIPNSEFKIYDGKTIPYRNNYFDLTFSTFVFEHLKTPKSLFDEIVRVTKNNGYILIVCPNYGSPFFRSPCNRANPFFLMLKRLFQRLLPSYFFRNDFRWNKVRPIFLDKDTYIIDYDTLVEPNLLFFKKFLDNQKKFRVIKLNSYWSEYKYGGTSHVKKSFLSVVQFLGLWKKMKFEYYGPYFFSLIQKIN